MEPATSQQLVSHAVERPKSARLQLMSGSLRSGREIDFRDGQRPFGFGITPPFDWLRMYSGREIDFRRGQQPFGFGITPLRSERRGVVVSQLQLDAIFSVGDPNPGEPHVAHEAELLDAMSWRPKPPVPSSLELAFLVWDFEKQSPDYEYEVELPEADFRPMYVEFVSAAYAAALDAIGDLKFPEGYGEGPGLLSSVIGVFPGMKRGRETDELWSMAVAWEFDTWLERMLRINGGDVVGARELIENRCPVPDYVADTPGLEAELLDHPVDPKAPDLRILIRWMGVRGWNDDRVREIVQEYSAMLNDWFKGAYFVDYD